jgi:protein-tyrosine phosphatase
MNTAELFDIVRLAHADWKRGKRVLIRCQAGWNRSGLITALVLIREGMGAREAIDLIREKRSEWALCNKSFEKFLLEQDPKVWQGDSYGSDTPKN